MKFKMEIDPEDNPDAVGECLRSAFFQEKVVKHGFRDGKTYHLQREMGCYQTFDWQKDVAPLPSLPVEEEHNHPVNEEAEELCWACDSEIQWTRAKKTFQGQEIECRWFWEGDGTLCFLFSNGSVLMNNDCKKDHGWCLHSSYAEAFPSWV